MENIYNNECITVILFISGRKSRILAGFDQSFNITTDFSNGFSASNLKPNTTKEDSFNEISDTSF
jgi:hypothetical protein